MRTENMWKWVKQYKDINGSTSGWPKWTNLGLSDGCGGCLIFQMILPLSFVFCHLILAVKAKLSFLNYVDGVYLVNVSRQWLRACFCRSGCFLLAERFPNCALTSGKNTKTLPGSPCETPGARPSAFILCCYTPHVIHFGWLNNLLTLSFALTVRNQFFKNIKSVKPPWQKNLSGLWSGLDLSI